MTQPQLHVPAYPQQGEVIDGKYQIERLLGEGGMGAVARAQHLLRRAPVALKFMSPHVMMISGAVERFLNEGVAASQMDSENVVKVYDVGKLASGAPYLVMECLDGQDLSDLLQREGTPGLQDVERAVHFVIQALRGLQVAHDAGIVHRDMKPSNCFVIQKDGEPDFVKLLDFGISKVQQPGGGHLTQTNSALGTPLYMSPEQAKSARNVDARSDLYSTAVILYELLSGRTPFMSESGEFTEILFKIFTTDPPPIKSFRPDLPDALCEVIHKGLARETPDRYQTAAEFAEALVPFADERSRQVVTRIRHRAANAGRPTNVPLSELGSMANQSMASPHAVRPSLGGAGATGKMTPAEMMSATSIDPVTGAGTAISAVGSDHRTAMSAGGATGSRRVSPLFFAAPAFLVIGMVTFVAVYKSRAKAETPVDSIVAPVDTQSPVPSAAIVVAPPTSAAPVPSASASASATAVVVKPPKLGPSTSHVTAPGSGEPKRPRLNTITIQE